MPLYHADRRMIRNTFEIPLASKKEKLECTIFEVWRDADDGKVVRCGQSESLEISITTGISEKLSTNIESTLSASIGPKYMTTLSASIKAALGHEVNWSVSKTTKRTFTITAPECGYYSLTQYQLCREYEFSYFQRGGWIFAKKFWDRKWTESITEYTSSTDSIPDKGHDDNCKCPQKPSLEYDGRLALDFGLFSMRVPYKINGDGSFMIMLAGQQVKFTFSDEAAAARGLHDGIVIAMPLETIPEPVRFLGQVPEEETSIEATIFMYSDDPTTASDETIDVQYLQGTVIKDDIVKPEEFLQH